MSNSVTRQVIFNRKKINGKCPNWKIKCDILSGQKLKMPKTVNFGEILKSWNLRSISVTRQVNLKWANIGEKCQMFSYSNATFWILFKHCVVVTSLAKHFLIFRKFLKNAKKSLETQNTFCLLITIKVFKNTHMRVKTNKFQAFSRFFFLKEEM